MSVLEEPLVLVDIETNGLSHIRGRVIEVAATRIEGGKIIRSFNQLIDPGTDIPAMITSLTGIRNQDVANAPVFGQIAAELFDILDGAIFVAHNVRFDYSFLKQEFKRVGKEFSPRQLCTVKLSRALYPEHRTHKLADLISRFDFMVAARHRAYDDARVLWDFLKHVQTAFEPDVIHQAITKQLKQPALPKGLDPEIVKGLPDTPGVYIFEDEQGKPLYVGKSITIRKRVLSHFSSDHAVVAEFKIAQQVRHISTYETADELQALLLESQLVKDLQPLYNKRLRRTSKLILAKKQRSPEGYHLVQLEEASAIEPQDLADILAVYAQRSKARESMDQIMRDHRLCPKLCGVEKAKGACFWRQLRKCNGACEGAEDPAAYNQRVDEAFERRRMQAWPFGSPVLVTPKETQAEGLSGVIIDKWCLVAHVNQEPYCEPVVKMLDRAFDLDTYKILQSHLTHKLASLRIKPLSVAEMQQLLT